MYILTMKEKKILLKKFDDAERHLKRERENTCVKVRTLGIVHGSLIEKV